MQAHADEMDKFFARGRRKEYAGKCRCGRDRILFLHAAHLHAHVAGLDDHGHAHRLERILYAVADLCRKAFLNLQAARECVHHAGDLAQAGDTPVGDIRHVRFAKERQHVVLAQRI